MIGLVTVYKLNNYGSSLQAFALKSYLEAQGYDVFVIMRQDKSRIFIINKLYKYVKFFIKLFKYPMLFKKYADLKNIPRTIDLSNKAKLGFQQFTIDYLNEKIFNYYELKKMSKENHIRALICGSDQIWSVTSLDLNPVNFLRFAPKFKRIAYAPSFGVSEIPKYQIALLKKYLKGFDYISIREQQGAKIIKDLIDKNVQVVLDPCLLVAKEFWEQRAITLNINKPYILCYFLNEPSTLALDYLSKIKNLLKYEVFILPYYFECYKKLNSIHFIDIKPFEFIDLIKNTSFLLTDSFHGLAFAVSFNIPFFVFNRQYGHSFNESSRVSSILNIIGLEERFINSHKEITSKVLKIDYNHCNIKLEFERRKSADFLLSSLKSIE